MSLLFLLGATGAAAQTIYVTGLPPATDMQCPPDNRVRAPRPATPAPEPVTEVPDEQAVGEMLAGEASAASATLAATAADGFPLLFSPPRHLRIGLWGDSHAAANIFSEALVQALGLSARRVLPSYFPPTMGNAGVRLPLRRSCMGSGWSYQHAYRNRDPAATWSKSLTRAVSNTPGSYLWLDFRTPALTGAFRTLDIRLSPGPASARIEEKPAATPAAAEEAGLGSALEPTEEGVATPGATVAGTAADSTTVAAPASGEATGTSVRAAGVVPVAIAAEEAGAATAVPDRLPAAPGPAAGAARLTLSVNDEPAQTLDIDPGADSRLRIVAAHPIATLKLELAGGSVGLDGFVPHYDIEPDYFFDTFGIPGATARGLQFQGKAWDADDPYRPYDLVIAEFGTNEGNYSNFDAGSYAQDLRKSLATLRSVHPEAACVLIGPTDRGVHVPKPKVATRAVKKCKGKGKKRKCKTVIQKVKACKGRKCKNRPAPRVKVDLLRYARVHATIAQVQAEVGRDFQCHAWSWQDAMGGPGGIYRWLYQKPALAQRDLIHLTGSGYRLSAQKFAQKLLGTTPPAEGEAPAPASTSDEPATAPIMPAAAGDQATP